MGFRKQIEYLEEEGEYLSINKFNLPAEADQLMEFHSQRRNQHRRRDMKKTHHAGF